MLNDPNIVITIVPKGADKISEFLAKVGRVKAKPDNWKDYYFGDVDKLADLSSAFILSERAKARLPMRPRPAKRERASP